MFRLAHTGANGPVCLDWLTSRYGPSHRHADLSAYFFRRAFWMLGEHGTQGLSYNAVKDPTDSRPEILHLRRLHEHLDRAVLEACGQSHPTAARPSPSSNAPKTRSSTSLRPERTTRQRRGRRRRAGETLNHSHGRRERRARRGTVRDGSVLLPQATGSSVLRSDSPTPKRGTRCCAS